MTIDKKTKSERMQYIKRLENLNVEQNLETKRKQLEDKIKGNKIELKKYYFHLTLCKKETEQLELDISFLNNYNAHFKINEKFQALKIRSEKSNEDFENLMKIKAVIDVCI